MFTLQFGLAIAKTDSRGRGMFRYRSTSCHLLPSLACASSSFSSEIRLCCNRGPSAFSPRWWMSQGILDQEYQEWTPRITIHELHWAASFGHEFLHYWTILDMDYDYDHHSWGIVLYIFPPIIHCSARDVGCLAALLSGPPVDLYSVLGNSWQQLHNQMAVVG